MPRHWLANQAATSIQSGQENAIQNEKWKTKEVPEPQA
jgi:hypothetical protein